MTYGGCEVRKRAVQIQQVKTGNNLSYSEAVKRVQGQRETNERPNQDLRAEEGVSEETETALTVEKLILFMAYVINCTDQVKHKTEKIKIIVRGAEKFFGLKGASWEHINKRLGEEGKPGGLGDKAV